MTLLRSFVASIRSIRLPRLSLRSFVASHRQGLRRWGARAAAAGGAALIVLLIHRSIYSFVSGQPSFSIQSATAKVDIAPSWADPRSGDGVVHFRLEGAEWTLFDDSLVARIGRSFEENPWVRRVTSVDRVFPDQVRVKFDLRRPVAVIAKPNGLHLVDSEGVRLPGLYAERPEGVPHLRFTGVASAPPAPGKPWTGDEIAAVLEMAALVGSEPVFTDALIDSVDLSNLGGRLDRRRAEIGLATVNGCVIEWGRLPSTRRHGEIPAADKLANLRRVLETYPDLEDRSRVRLHLSPSGEFPPTSPKETQLGSRKPRK